MNESSVEFNLMLQLSRLLQLLLLELLELLDISVSVLKTAVVR